jgi:hypothetical protein
LRTGAYVEAVLRAGPASDALWLSPGAPGPRISAFREAWLAAETATRPAKPRQKRANAPGCADLVVSEAAYREVDRVTDFFTERPRLACRGSDWRSPEEEWRDAACASRAAMVAVAAALESGGGLGPAGLREGCWQLSQPTGRAPFFREATNFKVTLAAAIYRLLGARWVLDACAGWGDRAFAAAGCAAVVGYVGVDPSPLLVPGHQALQACV